MPLCGITETLSDVESVRVVHSKTDWPWTMFDPESKQKKHDTVFPKECKKAFEMGAALF